MRLPSLAIIAAVVLVPAALATNSMQITPSADFSELSLDVRVEASGSESAQVRSGIDATFMGGNGDGVVSQAEVDAFEAKVKGTMGQSMADSVGDNVTMDGNVATDLTGITLDILDATGPVTSTAVLAMVVTATLHFPGSDGPTHTMFWQANADEGEATITVTVRAPDGYVIDSATGIPGEAVTSGKKEFQFTDSAANDQDATIVFAPESSGSRKSPAAGLGAVAVCLAAAILLRSKRT